MSHGLDSYGNVHDDNGQFVSLQAYIERIIDEREKQVERVFAERETSAEFKRVALKEALDAAKETTDKALLEAKLAVEQKLADTQASSNTRSEALLKRLDLLESGGAPFASRLDESLQSLKADMETLLGISVRKNDSAYLQLRADVEVLNKDAVRTKVLDALRVQTLEEQKSQKRQVRMAIYAAGFSFLASIILGVVQLFTNR